MENAHGYGRLSRTVRRRSALVLALGLLAVLAQPLATVPAVGVPGATAADLTAPVVRTDRGDVRGKSERGVDSFLGIRYAAAPVGSLRWAPPRPAERWTGVRAATEFGNGCPATESGNGPRTEIEDCLFVNVQRPADLRRGERRPVYVFFHGGGLANGSSSQHDSAPLVRAGGIVAVTLNYRLGVFGFFGHPVLTARQGESGNYGLMDQQAALRWVERNIAQFGGDPEQVTIGGESAGGWSVCAHLVAPASRGLFDAAVIQSGSCSVFRQEWAEAAGTDIAGAVGCSEQASALSCLRGAAVGSLLDSSQDFAWSPVEQTPTLPRNPSEAIARGQFHRVPVLIGANRDEGRTFTSGSIGMTRSEYEEGVRQNFPESVDAVLAEYPWPANSDEFTGPYLAGAYITDAGVAASIGGCTNRQWTKDLARFTPTWAYEFAHRTGPGLAVEPVGYEWGAGHAVELGYLYPTGHFSTVASRFDRDERRLADEMQRYWGSFVLDSDPNVDGQARWSRYDRTGRVLSLRAGGQSELITDAKLASEHKCAFWAELEDE